jgi:hypothetical protein
LKFGIKVHLTFPQKLLKINKNRKNESSRRLNAPLLQFARGRYYRDLRKEGKKDTPRESIVAGNTTNKRILLNIGRVS